MTDPHHARDRWRIVPMSATQSHAEAWLEQQRVVLEPDERDELQDEAKAAIAEAFLDLLSPSQRQAIELVVMSQIPASVAGEMLGISTNAVEKRLERARRKMRNAATRVAGLPK